jgi:hypothetical protein
MITIQQRLNSRLIGDVADVHGSSLQTLLGGSGRIFAGMDYTIPLKSPSIVFNSLANVPGDIQGDTVSTDVEHYTFKIFSNSCIQIITRLRVLLDRYTFVETTEAGVLRCVWDSDGPDLFDEDLKVRRKDTRFRIYSMTKAVGPV